MLDWTIADVARALGLDPVAPDLAGLPVKGFSIDSRTIASGELFFAIRGPRFDGHDFVGAALAAGACGAVVCRNRIGEYPESLRLRLLGVEDPAEALGRAARAVRRAWGQLPGRQLVAITGSTGKTTTKEMLAALLGAVMPVLKSEGNLNNAYGLPLTLSRLVPEHRAAVVEVGMSARGELRRLAAIAEPEVGVVTNVGPVHLEFFSSVEEIALAKRELIEGLTGTDTVAVLNADDPRVARFVEVVRGRVVWFGTGEQADVRLEQIEDLGLDGIAFDLRTAREHRRLRLPLIGTHNAVNAAAAVAAAGLWGVGLEVAERVLAGLRPAPHRGEVVRYRPGFTVVDDCYNSNPAALASMVNWLARLSGVRRKILVAGEMLELGTAAAAMHREAGRLAAGQVDWIFGVQGQARALVEGALEAGHPSEQARFFDTAEEAANALVQMIEPGDVVLVKGSRGVRLERVVERLAAQAEPQGSQAPGQRSAGTH